MIAAIIQARMTSSRLPGKVLKPILGIPMLGHQVARVRRARLVDRIVVATSEDSSDDPISEFCGSIDIHCFRGSLDDVLARYFHAAQSVNAECIVRLTGDCPLSDPAIIDALIGKYLDGGFDYVSNTLIPTFPDGLDAEVFSMASLENAWRTATLPSDREHVTPFIKKSTGNPTLNITNDTDLSSLRWTVDEPEDFDLVSRIFSALYPVKPDFGMADVLDVLEKHPEWSLLNNAFGRDEGYLRSLDEDAGLLQEQKNRSSQSVS